MFNKTLSSLIIIFILTLCFGEHTFVIRKQPTFVFRR
jgi:hypothetical protein